MVERWSIDGVTYCPVKKSDGAFVRYSDYAELAAENERLKELIQWAHDTLYEINPSNYDHDEVCKLNDASVEAILGLAPILGETHGKSKEWWLGRATTLASTSAVNVKRKDVIHQIALWSDDEGLDLSMGQGDDLASRILSALEDHPRATNTVVAHETADMSDKPEGHDDLAVDRFAAAMKAKLARKRNEGRGGWNNKEICSVEYLSRLLHEHVQKGDPLDVGNLAMMLHQRGERISPEGRQEPVAWRCKDYADGWVVYGEKSAAERHQRNDNCLMQALYTRPSEQAVTEAAVEAALKSLRENPASWESRSAIRSAIKAAMEAGG